MDNKGVPLQDLVTEIIIHTGMENTQTERDKIRQQIKRICEKISFHIGNEDKTLWEAARHGKNTKKPRYFFTEEQKALIFCSDVFQEFIQRENRLDDMFHWEWYQFQNEVDKRIEALQTEDFDEDASNIGQEYFATRQELQKVKINMMVEALFSVFFTPFNEEKLEEDMNLRKVVNSPVDETAETVAAEYRLFHPEGHYYERRKDKQNSGPTR